MLITADRNLISRVQIIPFGAASVGRALGQMIDKFPRPSLVFLDGDQEHSPGCVLLPGSDAPERIVFDALNTIEWRELDKRIGRQISQVIHACQLSMPMSNHHEWVEAAANRLSVGSNYLWQAMCAVWANDCASETDIEMIADAVKLKLST